MNNKKYRFPEDILKADMKELRTALGLPDTSRITPRFADDVFVDGNVDLLQAANVGHSSDCIDFSGIPTDATSEWLCAQASIYQGLFEEKKTELNRTADEMQKYLFCMAQFMMLEKRKHIRVPKNTNNQWVTHYHMDGSEAFEEISNAVYRMQTTIFPMTSGQNSVSYYAFWDVMLQFFIGETKQIARNTTNSFPTREEAERYIESKKEEYAHYFVEEFPPLPAEYAEHFTFHGQLLPGYSLASDTDTN